MANVRFSRQYPIIVVGLFVSFLLGLNFFTAFNINIINDEEILDLPTIKTVNGNISDIAITHISSTRKTKNRSNKFDASNETIDIGSPSLERAIHDNNHLNTTESFKENLNFTAPTPSVPIIVSNTTMGPLVSKINVGVKRTSMVKLPTPIFIASLPKSATTSVSAWFRCGKYKVADHAVNNSLLIGKCYEQNVLNDRSPFEGCGDFSVWSDTGYQEGSGRCYFPNVDGLEAFYESYPNGTVILVTRSPDSWYSSIQRYLGGKVKLNMIECNATGFPDLGATSVDWKTMYLWHQERVRIFARLHPSITYLEFSVDDPQVARKLEDSTGIKSSCWKVINANKKNLDLKEAALAISTWKRGKKLPKDFRNLRPVLSSTLTHLRNLDQVTGPMTTRREKRLVTPIFVVGLPDIDTSIRIHDYFTCGGYKSANYWTNVTKNNRTISIGECFQSNVNDGRLPFEGCGDVEVWTETGYATMDGQCFHPSVDGLEAFRRAYSNGTILTMRRRPIEWSLDLEENDKLRQKLALCNTTNFPGRPVSVEEWTSVYRWFDIFVQLHGQQNPSSTYLEFSLGDRKLPEKLEAVIGVNASCWD